MQSRILIIGTSGSGKTTLAKHLSSHLGIPHTELDALFHLPEWQARSQEEFLQLVRQAAAKPQWIICGNYGNLLQDELWQVADIVVWLDFTLTKTFLRALLRSLKRVYRKQQLWQGNQESFRRMLSKDSILIWILQTYAQRKKTYLQRMTHPAYGHLERVHIQSRKEYRAFLHRLNVPGKVRTSDYS